MSAPERYQWRRDKDGLGVWEHRGKVVVAGFGHSPVGRRWDGVSMDKTLGAYSILACRKAMDDAGVTPDQIEGVVCCDSNIAGGSGGSASRWTPRPYFAPPYDLEWGAHSGQCVVVDRADAPNLLRQDCLPSAKWWAWQHRPWVTALATPVSSSTRQAISKAAIVAVARTPTTTPAAYANGRHPGAITAATFINIFPHGQYCLKYGGKQDDLASFVINQHRNGPLTPWGTMPPTTYRSSPSRITSIRATS